MKNKLSPRALSLSLAAVSGIFYVLCAVSFTIAPNATMALFGLMLHGIDITQITAVNISLAATILGFFEIVILSLLAGWLFAVIYNCLIKA